MACDFCYSKEYGLELWAKWIIRDFRERSDHILGKSIWQSNKGGCAGDELGTGRWVWRQWQPQLRILTSVSRNKGEGNEGSSEACSFHVDPTGPHLWSPSTEGMSLSESVGMPGFLYWEPLEGRCHLSSALSYKSPWVIQSRNPTNIHGINEPISE